VLVEIEPPGQYPLHHDKNEFIRFHLNSVLFNPPQGVNANEINQMALIPLVKAFGDNVINRNPYRPEYIYRGYTSLRKHGILGIIDKKCW